MIPAERAHLYVAAATHPGMKGKPNEDRFSVSAYRISSENHTPSVLALIADGIGGHRAGEVAAELAVEDISKFVSESAPDHPAEVLQQALTHASQVILDQSRGDSALIGMGTTCVCAWVIGDQLYTASVGDSRLYLLRGDNITRLTTDHTWVQEALAHGILTPDQARSHPNAHIIRRYLGSKHAVKPDLRLRLSTAESDAQAEANQGVRLLPGDRLVLCSDGLTDLVDDSEILSAMQTNDRDNAPSHLVDLANQRGGHDNITIIALEVPPRADVTRPLHASVQAKVSPARNIPRIAVSCLTGTMLLVATLLLVSLLIWTFARPVRSTPTLTSSPMTSPALTAPALPGILPTGKPTLTLTPKPASTSLPFSTQPPVTYTPWPTNTKPPVTK